MASQTPLGIDRLRTNWTPAMERYFIDLLLDQVHRGNRMGHTFNKQAWNEMQSLFNANFGSPCDINVLKSRYTSLGTQFNDIKNLLDQNGFSWDESRQMVIANDHDWDAYIKAHPDAQSYRNKVLMNINDLCLIYAHTSADGRYSLSSHDIDFDDEVQRVNTGTAVSIPGRVTRDCPNTDCTVAMDSYFVKLMLDQVKNGNKIRNTFNKKAWKHMLKLFNKKFDTEHDESFLKHSYKKLRNYYSTVKDLIEVKGFSWGEKQQRIVADDDVWDNYIKAHPHVSSYRKMTLINYRDLGLIYGDTISSGDCSQLQEGYLINSRENSEGGYSQSACSVDLNSDRPILMAEGQDIQDCAIGGCSRTEWTASMDRYLIDLMLEEVRWGNKIDCALNNEACIDMIALFKERFDVQLDKDFLKSCCKSLEMLYHDMRKLLEQKGFSWDERQQMVTAYDDVWDAYIKEHPNAISYRNRRRPNYNDLCLVYGNSDPQIVSNTAVQDDGYNGDGVKISHWGCDWTLPMDRYFIDLMLAEVRYGSLINNKFGKLAWRDIVAKFRAEFGPKYNKNVLNNHFIILRKRFNDMKTLLNQSGFAWDEIKQMITADDRLWDAYVEEHPYVKAYRNKTLPNFNDLFLIYGNTNYGRKQQYSSYSSDVMDNELNAGCEEYNQSPANGESLRIDWTVKMDCYLIGLVLEQLTGRGDRIGDTFSKEVWAWMTTLFNREFGLNCEEVALENRYFGFMKVYRDITCLFNLNGIAWDEILQTARANDVWEAYFEEHPDSIAYGETVLENYSDLSLIYDNLNQNREPGRVRIILKTSNIFGIGTDGIMGNLQSSLSAGECNVSNKRKKRKSQAVSTSLSSGKVQRTLTGKVQEDLEEKPITFKTPIRDKKEKGLKSIESVVAALQTVPDMDDELFLEACVLLDDERKAKRFVAMDIAKRRKWLLKKLHQ